MQLGKTQKGDVVSFSMVREGVWSTEGFKKPSFIHVVPTGEDFIYESITIEGINPIHKGSVLPNREVVESIRFEDNKYLIYTDKHEDNIVDESQD
jgi:hypothetical protein